MGTGDNTTTTYIIYVVRNLQIRHDTTGTVIIHVIPMML